MWRAAAKEMKKHKIPASYTFDPNNVHKGEMPGWPKECNWTDNKAKRVLYACYRSGQLTFSQLRDVRKCLSYLYELKCGGDINKQQNWPGVKQVWKTFRWQPPTPVRQSDNSNVPLIIPSPKDLKRAFTTPWTPKTKMPLMKWVVGQVAAWDWGVCGARSQEDLDTRTSPAGAGGAAGQIRAVTFLESPGNSKMYSAEDLVFRMSEKFRHRVLESSTVKFRISDIVQS